MSCHDELLSRHPRTDLTHMLTWSDRRRNTQIYEWVIASSCVATQRLEPDASSSPVLTLGATTLN
jgi:hypothetical protein